MATLYITEYGGAGQSAGFSAALAPGIAEQTVAIGGSTTQSSAFSLSTHLIRVHTDAICSIAIGPNPTATTSKKRMAADQTEYWAVTPGDKIAVITNT